ncbi:uncharacterized protein IL334_007038 [Kwoniella shivajii]|uniref:THO1-MOS11 C-terminal domain-containing protein n=1 Tax=Kwoniella shivajii TaxID=564305 RepID=A0ABZ1D7K6_9TREE|nr:hypothetical protein IL334_007038 [Kwoniella shivajii]
MIRSNPTAIPLRANDVKLLQSEIDKRKAAREGDSSTSTKHDQGEKGKKAVEEASGSGSGLGIDGEERRDKYGRSLAERIGL